jgi:hypothetical protein
MRPIRIGVPEGLFFVCLALVFFGAIASHAARHSQQHDFLGRFTEGTLVWEGNLARLYDVGAQKDVQDRFHPNRLFFIPTTRPAFYALLMTPLAWMPVETGYWVWVGVQTLGLFVLWRWIQGRFGWGPLSAAAFFMPLGHGIVHGQDNVFVALLVLASFTLLEKGRDSQAGAIAALALFKWHLLPLLPLAMIIQKRWRMLAGYSAVGATAAVVSMVLASPRAYLELLTRQDLARLNPAPEMMPNVYGALLNFGASSLQLQIGAALALAVLALRPRPVEGIPFNWFWAAAAGSLLVTPHCYVYDISLLLVPLLMLGFRTAVRSHRILAIAALLPFPYLVLLLPKPWSVMPALIVLMILLALAGRLPEVSSQPGRVGAQTPDPRAC